MFVFQLWVFCSLKQLRDVFPFPRCITIPYLRVILDVTPCEIAICKLDHSSQACNPVGYRRAKEDASQMPLEMSIIRHGHAMMASFRKRHAMQTKVLGDLATNPKI